MASPNEINWDDVRLFLSVLRAASLRASSQQLGLSRPTVARRLTGLENKLGVVLFDRRPDGLHVTPAGAALRPRAEAV
ncbi:MAG: DNA-binding transcriptional LysR family regulator, partial [Cognaticolwellia sp.]